MTREADTRTIVIAGAGGLLGRELVRTLAPTERVYAVHRGAADWPAGVIGVSVDLSAGLDRTALPERADHVVYLAQSSRFREFPAGVGDVVAVNIARLVDMLDYARAAGARSFVLASTGGVYGTGIAPFAENGRVPPSVPLNFYAASKLSGELLAGGFGGQLSVVTLRYFFIYGPTQQPQMLVPRLIASVRGGMPIGLQGADGLSLNPIHVADAARATAAALDLTERPTLNVAGPEVLTLRGMGDAIGARFGVPPVYTVDPDAIPGSLIGDTTRMARELKAPTIRFADALRDWP